MLVVSRLQRALREVFEELHNEASSPEVQLPTVAWSSSMCFLPHPRVGHGDFSSAAALIWAAQSRTSAPALANRFVASLAQRIPGEWYEDNGFIVVKGAPGEWWSDELRTISEVAELVDEGGSLPKGQNPLISVHAIPPSEELPLYAGLRLLALAGVQAFFVARRGITCSLSFLGESPSRVTAPNHIAPLFEAAVRDLLRVGVVRASVTSRAWETVESSLQSARPDEGRFLWIAHHTSSGASQSAKATLAHCRALPRGAVRMPNDGWLISRERAIPEILLEPYLRETLLSVEGEEGWLRVLFHLSSSTPSSLFDPAVARFDELTSPWYSLHELKRRFQTLVPLDQVPSIGELRQEHVPDTLLTSNQTTDLMLWKSALRLPYRVVSAVLSGEVLEGVGALEEFCRLGHEYLNRPGLRHNLYKSEISRQESKILAGINLGLSSILS